jgi:F-type H+-transporting ATPase subunit epsilon
MPDVLELEIATPERQLVREEVAEVQLPGKNGYLGILPGHAALLSQLGTGSELHRRGAEALSVRSRRLRRDLGRPRPRVANPPSAQEEIDVEKARRSGQGESGRDQSRAGVDPAVALDALALQADRRGRQK